MIETPTILILGAGASYPYRFPLGEEMVTGILNKMTAKPETFYAGTRPGDLEDFKRKLRKADPTSIDAFLEGNNDEYVHIGKLAIANEILRAEDREIFFGRNLDGGHWYRYLWNYMHEGASKETFPQNDLTVVTFNYDKSFEYYFATVLENQFNLRGSVDAFTLLRESVRIIHLHGEVGDHEYGTVTSPTTKQIVDAAEGIRIVHDDAGGDEFVEARQLMSKATVVCFLGFGYHPTNIKRLEVKSHFRQHKLYGTAKGLMAAETRRAEEKIGRPIFLDDVDSLDFLRKHPVLK